ncbi:RNA-directed DNA polymerase, eukaryota [Tanacetum coccineum]
MSSDQVDELDRAVSRDEIRRAVWNCGENKSPGPDGYTFEFFRKYWSLVGADFCDAVDYFFKSGTFPRGCNSSFIALIPKVNDAKFVNDFRPISLIGCVYKVITKVLANRLATVISDLVSETQSAFVANRQILDGPFILNEVLNWCKRKRKQAMFFKVDFAKAYDSVRWDYLLDILQAFGFGPNWCRWIRGTFTSSMASILVNGSPTSEFPFCCGLKQGDPLAPYLFILIMESLHISFSRVVDDGLFKGFQLHGSVNISHLFYADDAMFIGEWSEQNLHNIVKVLNCFHLASGLKINIAKSQVLGVGVSQNVVLQAANRIGCAVLNTPFRYLGVTVGECMSRKSAWVGLVNKLQARLSKWKVKTLSIGGRLTLLKSVLGASPIYYMSIFKVPKGVLKTMESIRSKFFNGVDSSDRKISWVAWDNVLASKLNGGLGVSSFFALNRALLLKWVWRFISGDGSLWCKVIQAIYGSKFDLHVTDQPSIWCSILREVKSLKDSGFDFSSHCKKRIGDGSCTSFWYDIWLADAPLCVQFPRLFALELDKEIVVANKMGASSVSASFRRDVRDGAERQQWDDLSSIMNSVVLSSSKDRWTCDLSGDGEFKVKVIRNFIDDLFLPSSDVATRWVKFIPIKVNVFSWRARRDRLPTRVNLSRRGVLLDSHLCPLCNAAMEDVQHVFFRCDVARVVLRKICRWWDLDWQEICSFSDWDAWFLSFRLSSRLKSILEGVFYVAWWRIWRLRNQLVFDASPPNRSTIFDDIVSWSFLWCSSRCGDFAQGASDFPEFEVSKAKYFKKYLFDPKPHGITNDGNNLPRNGNLDSAFLDLPSDQPLHDTVKKGSLADAVAYIHAKHVVTGSYTDIVIWLYYPFNGPAKFQLGPFIIPLGKAGQHGKWLKATEFEYKDGRPVVYASLHNHAHYNAPKSYIYYDAEIREFTSAYPRKSMLFSFPVGRVDKAAKGDCVFDILATPSSYEIISLDYGAEYIVPPPSLIYEIEGVLTVYSGMGKKDVAKAVACQEGPAPKMKPSWYGDESE